VGTGRSPTSNNNGYWVYSGGNTGICPYSSSSSGGGAAAGISLGIIIPLLCICCCLFGMRRRRQMNRGAGMNYVNMGGPQETVIVQQGPYAAPPVAYGGAPYGTQPVQYGAPPVPYGAPPVPYGGNQTVIVEERGRFGRHNETIVVNTY
jgi:hypothetical protein